MEEETRVRAEDARVKEEARRRAHELADARRCAEPSKPSTFPDASLTCAPASSAQIGRLSVLPPKYLCVICN